MTPHPQDVTQLLVSLGSRLQLLELALAGHAELACCTLGAGVVDLVDGLQRDVQGMLENCERIKNSVIDVLADDHAGRRA